MAQNRVFVSPGFYSSEKDLTFVNRQIGVTSLGLVGETTKGPAFQPIFVSNYNEFSQFFGGLNAKKVKDTGYPQYELPYVAKSFLSKANQLYVTRVLGLSGYDAGKAWAITLDAALDTTTVVQTATVDFTLSFTASTTATTVSVVSNNAVIQQLFGDSLLTSTESLLGDANISDNIVVGQTFYKSGANEYIGASFNLFVTNTDTNGSVVTGTTTGSSITYSGTGYSDVDNKVVVLLRSRAKYNGDEQIKFEIVNQGDLIINPSVTGAALNPLGSFVISGTSNPSGYTTQGNFSYEVSLDKTNRNYITRVFGKTQEGKTPIYVEEIFNNMFEDDVTADKVRGINLTLVDYATDFVNYKTEYAPAMTPYVLSEIRGNKLFKLFRFCTISDGNTANEEIKISIANIKPDEKEFDVLIRAFYDTDANPVILEKYAKCTMDPTSANYIGRKVGTIDGFYEPKSSYVLVELTDDDNIFDAFPAGFDGVAIRDYGTNLAPNIEYKKTYTTVENKRKAYLGISNITGIDQDFFNYKGLYNDGSSFTGKTSAFHLDVNATNVITLDNQPITFETGNAVFQNEATLQGTDYEKLYARKFTFTPFGGFDGWDTYRTRRTNTDTYSKNASGKALKGLNEGTIVLRSLTNGDTGNSSDYFAFLEAIRTYANPEAVNINVLATPGIDIGDNSNLVEETIEMVEQERADSLYIVTTPDFDGMTAEEAVAIVDDSGLDSNYTATYWPWVQINDTENNVLLYVPPTRDVVRNIAITDNVAFPWYAVAGVNRGDMQVIKARKKLDIQERDDLYEGRINPIMTFASEGVKIWGNKNLQVKDTALNRINVRRLLLQARKLIAAVAIRLLFEQNDDVVRNQFLNSVNPILNNIRSERGLTDFRVDLDRSPESIDRNELNGKIFIKPTRSLEFISIEFVVMPTGASFSDI